MQAALARLGHELRLALVALQFLTRVPVLRRLGFEPDWLQQSIRHFPLVGAAIGGFAAGALWLALALWPPAVAAVLAVAATAWLTGAFHEDGLADTLDALGGGVPRERALAIMKDSRIGSYGALALVLAVALQVAALAALAAADAAAACAALVWAHAASRALPLWLVWRLPYAGDAEHAKAKPLATTIGAGGLGLAAATLAALAALLLWALPAAWPALLAATAATAATGLWCRRWLRRRLGGFTGDTLGAAQQIALLAALLAWLAAGAPR
jgi:adenosylcobinamide-GDP ribazoletransferase